MSSNRFPSRMRRQLCKLVASLLIIVVRTAISVHASVLPALCKLIGYGVGFSVRHSELKTALLQAASLLPRNSGLHEAAVTLLLKNHSPTLRPLLLGALLPDGWFEPESKVPGTGTIMIMSPRRTITIGFHGFGRDWFELAQAYAEMPRVCLQLALIPKGYERPNLLAQCRDLGFKNIELVNSIPNQVKDLDILELHHDPWEFDRLARDLLAKKLALSFRYPMALSLDAADRVRGVTSHSAKPVRIYNPRMYHPVLYQAKRFIQGGAIGSVQGLSATAFCQTASESESVEFLELPGLDLIPVITELLGSITAVFAYHTNQCDQLPAIHVIQFRAGPRNLLGTLTIITHPASAQQQPEERSFEVYGTDGTIRAVLLSRYGVDPALTLSRKGNHIIVGGVSTMPPPKIMALGAEAMITAIRRRSTRPLLMTPLQGRHCVRVNLGIREALSSSQLVVLPTDSSRTAL